MSNYDLSNAWKQDDVSGTEFLVLLFLADCKNDKTGQCNPSLNTIAKHVKCGARQVKRHIGSLRQKGVIFITKERRRGQWPGNQYDFHWNQGTSTTPGEKHQGTSRATHRGTSKVITGGHLCHPNQKEETPTLKKEPLEDKMSTPPDGVVNGKADKVTDEHTGKIHPISKTKDNYAPADDDSTSPTHEMTEADWRAATAMVWFDLNETKVKGKKISKRVGVSLVPLNDDEKQLLEANRLVSNYRKACKSSPNARVGFWFAIKRLYFPKLPSSTKGKKLLNLDSKMLHELFDRFGPVACYVIADSIATWEPYLTDYGKKVDKYPTIELMLQDRQQRYTNWVTKFVEAFDWQGSSRGEKISIRLVGAEDAYFGQKELCDKLGVPFHFAANPKPEPQKTAVIDCLGNVVGLNEGMEHL